MTPDRKAALDELVRLSEEAGLYDLPPWPKRRVARDVDCVDRGSAEGEHISNGEAGEGIEPPTAGV